MDIEGWLRGLGLERYVEPFRANDIGLDVLGELSEADLATLGVSLGDRKRLRLALSGLRDVATPDAPAPRPGADRRQLTVMFVDLVGSTALSTHLDPEELRDVIQAYHNAVAAEITRLEGHVAKLMGDGVLAYFGWPRAHEDAAERAVRAGIAATAAVARLPLTTSGQLAARVGIATGLVVVGHLVGEGAAQEKAVVGETPNLAARLQALAEPGTVVVAASTRRLLGQLFAFTDLGAHRVAGFASPVPAFQVAVAASGQSRFEALHGQHLTPLVGREHEFGLLLDRWHQARDGDGQVVLLAGEPGIGKSRMLASLCQRVADEPHFRLRYFCSPYHQNTAFHPILDQIARAARLAPDDPPATKRAKLEALFALSGRPTADATAMTAAMLGIASDAGYEAASLGPQGRKAKLQEIWLQQLVGLASRQPVLMLLEDAHWIDPTSIEQFDLVIDHIQRLPVLLVAAFRPDFPQPWGRYPHVTSLSLNRFSARQSAAMVGRIAGGKPLPAIVLDQIVAKADGVPLFVEELTKAVLEGGLLLDGGDHWDLSGPALPLAIPATLHDSLMARLDRLAPIKELAQIAAAIGREFPRDLLATVSRFDDEALEAALAQLCATELIFRRSMPPNAVYAFKHALVQEAAYASLLRGPRQLIHARIAAALQAGPAHGPPEVLAHHLTEGGQAEQSVEFWAQAGRQSASRAASREAVAHFQRALAQLLSLPETVERKRREAALQSALGGVLVNVAGLASQALERTYVRVRELCRETGDVEPQFVAEWNLWHIHFCRAEHRQGQALVAQLMAAADTAADHDLLLQAHHAEWSTLAVTGEHRAATLSCERGWALYDRARHGTHAFTYAGHDPGVCSRNQMALASWCLGQPERALACYEEELALARRLEHPQIVAHALTRGLLLFELSRDLERLKAQAAATLDLAAEQDFASYRTDAQIFRAWALCGLGEPEQAVRLIAAAMRERGRLGSGWNDPFYLSLLARAQAQCGAFDEALAKLDDAIELARHTGEAWLEPDLLRIRGDLLLGQGGTPEAAERCFQAALDQARASDARAWELRAATSLARLWAMQGRGWEAGRLLAPVYQSFKEGFATPDLQDARTLLARLA